MNLLGVYFGPKCITVVESKGKKIVNSVHIPQLLISSEKEENKVPEEVKITAFLKEELRKQNISAKKGVIVLSGNDLIIRTFEMPVMPRDEINNAVAFEVRKYVPFKIEELALDYQMVFDNVLRKNFILGLGIKKNTLERRISILKELDIEIVSVEYAAFSILRLLPVLGVNNRGIILVVDADIIEVDEANCTVLENGFPLFSRDIILSPGVINISDGDEVILGMLAERLKVEIRVSLDYYHRKFPTKKIDRAVIIFNDNNTFNLEAFFQECGLKTQFLQVDKCLGKTPSYSLSLIKAYAGSLFKTVNSPIKINLLAVKKRHLRFKESDDSKESDAFKEDFVSIFRGLHINPIMILLGVLICSAVFGYTFYQRIPVKKELDIIISKRPKVDTVSPDSDYDSLAQTNNEYKKRINDLEDVIRKQLYITEPLAWIPRLIPDGIWLESFAFQRTEDEEYLILKGFAYLRDSSREFNSVNGFVLSLKGSAVFSKYFKDIRLVSVENKNIAKISATSFEIRCSK